MSSNTAFALVKCVQRELAVLSPLPLVTICLMTCRQLQSLFPLRGPNQSKLKRSRLTMHWSPSCLHRGTRRWSHQHPGQGGRPMQFTKQGCLIKLALRNELQPICTQPCLLLRESLNCMIGFSTIGSLGTGGCGGENAHSHSMIPQQGHLHTCAGLGKGQSQ